MSLPPDPPSEPPPDPPRLRTILSSKTLERLDINPDTCREEAVFLSETAASLAAGVESAWAANAILGHALAEGAERALLTDLDLGTALVRNAGDAYRRAGLPYGLALLSAIAPPRVLPDLLFNAPELRVAAQDEAERDAEGGENSLLEAALKRPEQVTYLLIALAADRAVWRECAGLRRRFVERLARGAHLPVGPLGISIASHLLLLEGIEAGGGAAAAEALGEMMTMRRAKLSLARRSRYLWRRLWLPFAYTDLHLVCVARALLAAHGPQILAPWLEPPRREDAGAELAALPLRVALALGDRGAPSAGAL